MDVRKRRIRFTGQEFEQELDINNYKARLYDPDTGRFAEHMDVHARQAPWMAHICRVQPDPIHTERTGLDSYDPYQYAGANPIMNIDPDGKKMCHGNTVAALVIGGSTIAGGVIGGTYGSFGGPAGTVGGAAGGAALGALAGTGIAAATSVMGNYTGGGSGGDCSTKWPNELAALGFVLAPLMGVDFDDDKSTIPFVIMLTHYYDNYVEGHGPTILNKLNRTELQFSMLYYHNYLQSDSDPENDSYALIAYFALTEMVANPRFEMDEASFYHDQYGPDVFEAKNRPATSQWVKRSHTIAFSHDSWSRTYKREKKATPKSWGDARGLVAGFNTAGTVIANAALSISGTILFGTANILSGLKR